MKKQTFTVTGKLSITEKMKNSTMGNPRYQFVIVGEAGEVTSLYTGVDSSYGYSITNYNDKNVSVEYSIVRGKATLKNIEKV